MIRTAYVSDQPISALGLRTLLESQAEIELVGEFTSQDDVVKQVEKFNTDILILDCYLLINPSEFVVRQFSQAGSNVKICVLNQIIDEGHFLALINAGVNGYLLTSEPLTMMIAAIHSVAAGGFVVSDILEQFLPPNQPQNRVDIKSLTKRELEVLGMIAAAYSNAQIAEKLHISIGTVKNHSKSIFKKLNVHTRVEATLFGLQHGLVKIR